MAVLLIFITAWAAALGSVGAVAAPAEAPPEEDRAHRYTFSWLFTEDDAMAPRGGTTEGPEVTLAEGPSEGWQRIVESGPSEFERDRRAILAMAGAYRTTFDFIETVGFTPDYQPRPPYQSWGTEYIYVIADEPRSISLQHVLVMKFQHPDGTLSDPVVVKHWRQDWHYEDNDIHVFEGNGRWSRRKLPAEATKGAWTQAVFQVDDSPRYQAAGRWEHKGNHSTWTSSHTWRPLPRREFSVRDDYDLLAGTNRVTITPRGWVHEEDNLKVVLNDAGEPAAEMPYLAREAGLNRYEHIVGYDFSAGDAYWQRTAPFWSEVRQAWRNLLSRHDELTVRDRVDGEPLFQVMFQMAERFAGQDEFDAEAAREQVRTTLERFVDAG